MKAVLTNLYQRSRMALGNFLNPENIHSYAFASAELFEMIHKRTEFTNVIVPSRGAHPFMHVVKMLQSALFSFNDQQQKRTHYLPFTSDFGGCSDVNSKAIRKFWVGVLIDKLNSTGGKYGLFYDNLANIASTELGIVVGDYHSFEKAQTGEPFIFVDTCISGRAISEIIEGFQDLGQSNYLIIAIVDKSRGGPREPYARILSQEVELGRLQFIMVDRLFSEDQSPLLNCGCTSVVFPNLIEEMLEKTGYFKDFSNAGAGVYLMNAATHLHGTPYNGIRGIMMVQLFTCARSLLDSKSDYNQELSEFSIKRSVKEIEADLIEDPLHQSFTRKIAQRFVSKGVEGGLDISRSHVVRINLDCGQLSRALQFD